MKETKSEISKAMLASFYLAPALAAQAMTVQANVAQNANGDTHVISFEKLQKAENSVAGAGGIKAKIVPPISLQGKTLDDVITSARLAGYDVEVVPA